jgi:hypothetical protein
MNKFSKEAPDAGDQIVTALGRQNTTLFEYRSRNFTRAVFPSRKGIA